MVSVPTAPGPWRISSWTNTRVNGKANTDGSGGATILQWQIGWGLSPNQADFVGDLNPDGSGFISGLTPGKTYYFWNRQRNSAGWSDMSSRTQVTMKDRPDAPKMPVAFSNRTQTSVKILVAPNDSNGSPITSYTLAYGTSPASADVSVTHQSASFYLSGLIPGEGYYLWAKTTNAYGTSEWSARGAVVLVAGAMVKVGLTWKRAVPYVKVGGVWQLARTWSKSQGVWKETAD